MDRRRFVKGAALFTAGAATAASATLGGSKAMAAMEAGDPLPLYSGPAASVHDDRRTPPRHSSVGIHYGVDTTRQLIALTFDDGPMPNWTPKVLDTLDELDAPATFFMIGQHVQTHADLVRGRLSRHEVGNHTWAHLDLAKSDYRQATEAITKAHDAIEAATGLQSRLLRPPYGHLSGSTVLAAADLGYDLVLWNLQMIESEYPENPAGLADYIVNKAAPGTVLLAHDTGNTDRLVALNGLPAMITGLRQRGFEFVTVSQLLAA
jgi:peptidoglycan/xylan/chitin deacetylase (PgdA/CDA1 family)